MANRKIQESILCRCTFLNQRNITISNYCDGFYVNNFDDAYYDGVEVPGIREALDYSLFTDYSNVSSQCVELIGHYLCHYYFPICDMDHDTILPVCSSSCNLIVNNEECLTLFMNAVNLIAEQNITTLPSNDSCTVTYRPFVESDQPEISDFCLDIEGMKITTHVIVIHNLAIAYLL